MLAMQPNHNSAEEVLWTEQLLIEGSQPVMESSKPLQRAIIIASSIGR